MFSAAPLPSVIDIVPVLGTEMDSEASYCRIQRISPRQLPVRSSKCLGKECGATIEMLVTTYINFISILKALCVLVSYQI